MAEEQQGEGRGGGFSFTKKLGPMPVWAWMGIALALALVYSQWSKNKKAASTANANASVPTTTTDQTPPFIIQNYTNTPLNGAKPPRGGATGGVVTPVTPNVGQVTTLVVKAGPGDTWASIASKFGISAAHLQQFNAVAGNRGNLGTINTSAPLTSGQQVAVPFLNQ